MTQDEINKTVKSGKMKMFDVPFELPDNFINKWKEQSTERADKGFFIDIKKTDKGINVLSIGDKPEMALFFIGLAYGAYGR